MVVSRHRSFREFTDEDLDYLYVVVPTDVGDNTELLTARQMSDRQFREWIVAKGKLHGVQILPTFGRLGFGNAPRHGESTDSKWRAHPSRATDTGRLSAVVRTPSADMSGETVTATCHEDGSALAYGRSRCPPSGRDQAFRRPMHLSSERSHRRGRRTPQTPGARRNLDHTRGRGRADQIPADAQLANELGRSSRVVSPMIGDWRIAQPPGFNTLRSSDIA